MTDIVERLRAHALPDPHDEREVLHAPLLREAASEIERLRKIESAARNLVAQKGRHHTEQAYKQLAAMIKGVK